MRLLSGLIAGGIRWFTPLYVRMMPAAVMLKMTAAEYPVPRDLARLRREFDLMRTLHHAGVVQALELLPWENGLVLVTEAAPGIALRELLAGRNGSPLPVADALRIAVGVSDALAAVHAAGIVHKDVTPANIIVQPSTLLIHLIDFGLAASLPRESRATRNPEAFGRDAGLPSPRTNRAHEPGGGLSRRLIRPGRGLL